jgi:MoaA/NifB/PqqE/SkfB family radical SAM enzyme
MQSQSIIHTLKRYQTLATHKISVLPIAILMPHSACNCRCVMCDIWKDNKNAKQLTENDISELLVSLKKLDTKRIVMSGGEALLNKNFFVFCEIIKKQNIKITLLTTGLSIDQYANKIVDLIDDVIVSLDGDEELHNQIRNVPNAFQKLKDGIIKLKQLDINLPISARCVIHNLNFRKWGDIISAAKYLNLDSISFLPADVSSEAFNREVIWEKEKQDNLLVSKNDLPEFQNIIDNLKLEFETEFLSKYIVESPEKIQYIYQYYSAQQGIGNYPAKDCNAPWVSAVIEADGNVRPCFFHNVLGNIHNENVLEIINSSLAVNYRKNLNTQTNATCVKCVCYLNLSPRNIHY